MNQLSSAIAVDGEKIKNNKMVQRCSLANMAFVPAVFENQGFMDQRTKFYFQWNYQL